MEVGEAEMRGKEGEMTMNDNRLINACERVDKKSNLFSPKGRKRLKYPITGQNVHVKDCTDVCEARYVLVHSNICYKF